MDLLKQCQQWFEQDEAQKVIDTLEAIPAEERTLELDSELAKAYIAVAHIGEREPFEKALELLAPHEEYFAEDHCWNYRIALAYYCLDEEGPALRYFEKALKARPGDKDTQEYINDCRRRLSLPRFEKNFRERTQEAWAAFSQIEAELRQIIDTDETHQRGEELVEKCGNALKTALRDTSFELGFNGEKHELILSPEGLRSRLFPLVYFQKQAPESVLEHWNIWVGRQPCEGFELRAGEIEVRAEDVQMWAEETEDHQVSLVLYCEKLTPILKEDTDKVWWALSMLVDQTIGEVSAIAFVAGFDVYAQPKDEPAKLLSELPELLQSMGLSLWRDGSDYLENSYLAYELEPVEDPEADWRLDVYTGSCRLPVLINDYLTARSDMVDEYHKDGIAAGFLLYPLSGFTGEERVKAILDFRDNLRDAILRDAGEEAVTFLGGATGLYCGYLDFIAWDLPAVLTAAQAFFEGSDLPYAHFHAFRRDVGGVPLLDEKEPEPDIHEETGSLLSTEDIEILESFDEGTAAYFGKMLDWLENFIKSGVEEGRFSEKQAHQDLQIALWYAFACLNLDDYIHYYLDSEVLNLFEVIKGHKIELVVLLTAFYGLRRSEVIGLKWSAFDFNHNCFSIRHTVTTCNVKGERVTIKKDKAKNKSSLRTYPLIPFLKERLLEAKKQQEENRKLCGRAYNKEYLGYVCVDVIGNLIKPNYVSSTFGKLLAKNNLRHIRFHDLRHTCASLLLANGVPMEQVKEWLGHSEISTTVDIYGHLQYATKKQSAAAIEQDIVAPMLQNLSAVSP